MDAILVPTFERHNRCLSCGYDLFGQPRTGVCPECGTSTRESARQDALLSLPGNPTRLRKGVMYLLISSVLVGLCPGVCVLFLASDASLWVAILMTLIFAATAATSAIGEERLAALFEGELTEAGAQSRSPRWSRLRYDIVAGAGLLSVNLAAYAYAIDQRQWLTGQVLPMAGIGIGFFLLCVTAWRAVPAYALRANVSVACLGPARGGFASLGYIKAIYETVWLACCWVPPAMVALSAEDAGVVFAFGALFGLVGFAGVWIAMIVVHAVLFQRVRQRLGAESERGFEVIAVSRES